MLPNQSTETEAGTVDTAPLQETALTEVAMTTLPLGMDALPMTITVNYFRPPRPQPGNILAQARVVNSPSVWVTRAGENCSRSIDPLSEPRSVAMMVSRSRQLAMVF
jgi:hypothetical protein